MDKEASGSTYNPVLSLSKAVEEVQKGSDLSATAAKYNIPASILHNRVLDIRHLKEKIFQRDIQIAANTNNQVPDKFGLIVNEKFFKCKRLANPKGVYVDQRYYEALHFIFNGGSRDEAKLKYKLIEKVLKRKIREVKFFLKKPFNSGKMNAIEKQLNKDIGEKIPKLSKNHSLFPTITYLVETFSLLFPEEFLVAISNIEQGADFKNVAEKFSFNIKPFTKVVRSLRFLRGRNMTQKRYKVTHIKSLLPSIHSSFGNMSLTKTESLAMIKKFYKKKARIAQRISDSWKSEDLEKAINDINNGISIKTASKKYEIAYSTLQCHASKRGNLILRTSRKRSSNRSTNSIPGAPTMLSKEEIQVMNSPATLTSPATKSLVKGKVKKSQLLCLFCHQPGNREDDLGKLHVINKVVVHYYCLLFSCALEQNGKDEEGILGFLPKDIMKEINRGSKLKCIYCGLKGATVGCNNKYCKKAYHFPCGLDNFAQFIFTDNFSSMCIKHRKFQNGQGIDQSMECPICMEVMVADPKFAVWAPCCKKSSWFHRKCIQKLALSAGYFFKCPLCNDRNNFTSEMLHQGIFVPDQDASWELEPNAFQELLERPIRCDASICKCPAGRKSDEEGTRWEVLLCYLCGSTGIHIACGKLKATTTEWHCPTCIEMLKESTERAKEENRIRRRNVRRKRKSCAFVNSDCDDLSAEEMDIETIASPFKRKRCSSSLVIDLDQPSSSKGLTDIDVVKDAGESLDSSDEIVCVPKGIRGDIVIKDLLSKGESLSEALEEMKIYAEKFQSKMAAARMDEHTFLEILNHCASGSVADKCYKIDGSHLSIFGDCLYNFDQMRLLRKVFELVFFLQSLKLKINKASRANPFSRKKRRYKDLSKVKESLVNLLVKAKSANLLDGQNTWSSYGNRKKNAYFNNNKDTDALPSTSRETVELKDNEDKPSNLASYRFIRILDNDKLLETCMWCNMFLVPGNQPTTIRLSLGSMEVICTSCLTCNVFNNVFPKLPYSQPAELKPASNDSKEISVVESENMEIDVQMDRDSLTDGLAEKNDEVKTVQSSILSYFSPKSKEKERHSSSSSTSKCDQIKAPSTSLSTSKNIQAITVSASSTSKCNQIEAPSIFISISKKDQITTLSTSSTSKCEQIEAPPSTSSISTIKNNWTTALSTSSTSNSTCKNEQTKAPLETKEDLRKVKVARRPVEVNLSAKNNLIESDREKELKIVNTLVDKPLRVFKLEEDKSQPRKVKLVEEKPLLRAVRHTPDSSGPRLMKLVEGNPHSKIVELTEEKTRFGVSKLVETKSEPRIIRLTEDKPQPKIIRLTEDKSPKIIKLTDQQPQSKVIHFAELQLNEKSNKNSNFSKPNNVTNVINSQSRASSTPPSHPSMSISFSNKNKICKTCEKFEKGDLKSSTIYCPCCSDVPTFCSQKHFDKWHSVTHNWVTIPPSQGISKPYKKCKVCPEQNFTRYFCPACPEDIGYCSIEHFNKEHPNETLKLKSDKDGETSGKINQIKLPSGLQYPIIMKPDSNLTTSRESLKGFRIRHSDTKDEINTAKSNGTSGTSKQAGAETSSSIRPTVYLSSSEGLSSRLLDKGIISKK